MYMVTRSYVATGSAARAGGKHQAWELLGLQYFWWRDHSRVLKTGWRRSTGNHPDFARRQNPITGSHGLTNITNPTILPYR